MKHNPTPRDLFNPPPQARFLSNEGWLQEMRDKIEQLNSRGYYTITQELFYGILGLIEDLDERIGKPL